MNKGTDDMAMSAKSLRTQLALVKPLLSTCSLKTIRKAQNRIGELMAGMRRSQVVVKPHPFDCFQGVWVSPRDERRQGVILYLYGGGFTCGGVEYAAGCGSWLAAQTGTRVFCAAYRLAPETPFPGAVEDALTAYEYLLDKGYSPDKITLCGESAGGNLCYALCMELRRRGKPLPCGIIALSPWVDLTASGSSYETNRDRDPSLSKEVLDYFTDCYTKTPDAPLASPLWAELKGMPPSTIFVGADEILLEDARRLHEKLCAAGCESELTVAPERWHAYLLYGLEEDQKDLAAINRFLNRVMARENKLRWMRLDNAAKIYPAARRQNWSNVFRLSMTLTEEVDTAVLQSALDVTVRRFPSIAARLRRGVFWYYLQQLSAAPPISEESSYPLTKMSRREIRRCAFRVIVYKKRIAVELFHSLTDGTGAMVFLKSLVAEYLQQKHGVHITAEHGVLGRLEEPDEGELEDSFQKYAGQVNASRQSTDAWRVSGVPEEDDFLHLTCFRVPVQAALEKAHEYGVSLTAFLCAVMMQALQQLQAEKIPERRRRKAIKVLVPVNLRRMFPSKSLRNFAMYTVPEILPKLGEYSFEEICKVVHHRMGMEITPKHMSMMIATNVSTERILAVKLMPLFLKNLAMKMVFNAVGERKSSLSLSNLGKVTLPEEMMPYVERMDFILGVQATAPHNCGVLSYGDELYINFIRKTRLPELESRFYAVLRDLGLPVQVQSNSRD